MNHATLDNMVSKQTHTYNLTLQWSKQCANMPLFCNDVVLSVCKGMTGHMVVHPESSLCMGRVVPYVATQFLHHVVQASPL